MQDIGLQTPCWHHQYWSLMISKWNSTLGPDDPPGSIDLKIFAGNWHAQMIIAILHTSTINLGGLFYSAFHMYAESWTIVWQSGDWIYETPLLALWHVLLLLSHSPLCLPQNARAHHPSHHLLSNWSSLSLWLHICMRRQKLQNQWKGASIVQKPRKLLLYLAKILRATQDSWLTRWWNMEKISSSAR